MTAPRPSRPEAPKSARLPRELVSSTIFLFKRLGDLVKERAVPEFVAAGCNPYHHAVLAVLGEGASETQARIAAALGFDPSALVGLLDELEEQGLVERHRDPSDRRRHAVSITPDGLRTVAHRRGVLSRIENDFLAPLDRSERETLHALLLKLARHHDARYDPGV